MYTVPRSKHKADATLQKTTTTSEKHQFAILRSKKSNELKSKVALRHTCTFIEKILAWIRTVTLDPCYQAGRH